ncbi:PKD-like family lipoprotein [Longitalea arenae]|uniref:PKD-like family lipoprotein n=1 Tax=Longitalea arenae TaxID=2812558 RepID=UPI00196883C4|nr:PKD-like family lipoprotein [Longitalea arenae]
MKQITIYSLLSGLLLLSSCYKDKGNYDYATLNKVTILIDGDANYITPRVADTLHIDPRLIYRGDTLRASTLTETFAFTWYCNDEQISSSPVLDYPVRKLTGARPYLKLKVVNKNDASTFLDGVTVDAIPAYLTGWVVLTKKDNRSIISFIDPVSFEVNADFYTTVSEKELGPNAMELKEIWAGAGITNPGNILIVRNDGGGNIELDGITLNAISNSNNFFLGNTLPPDFRPRGEFYMWDYTLMLDDNGNIYMRKHVDNSLTQSGVYPNKPMFIGGGVQFDKGWDGTFLSGQTLLYDKTQGKLFLASDNGGAVLPVNYMPGPPVPPGTTLINAMDKELVYVGRLQQGRFTSSYYLVFFDGTKYYQQKVMIMDQRFTVSALFMGETPLGAGTANAQSVFCQLPRIENYMFYSGGSGNKTLYLHEQGPGMSSEYFTFDSPIKIITAAQNNIMGINTHDQLMVALENGDVYILGILSDQLADPSKRLIKKIVLNQGLPVSGMYKTGFGYYQM